MLHGMARSSLARHLLAMWVLASGFPLASAAQQPPAAAVADRFTLPATDEGLPGAGPIRRYDWFQSVWRERRSAWAAERAQDQGAVVFSATRLPRVGRKALGWPFPESRPPIVGSTATRRAAFLIRLQEDVLALNPAAVVLLIGTNDLEEGATPEIVAGNLR